MSIGKAGYYHTGPSGPLTSVAAVYPANDRRSAPRCWLVYTAASVLGPLTAGEVRDLVEQGEITIDTRVQYAHGLTVGASESLHSVAELVPVSALPVVPAWVPGVGVGS